MMMEASVIAGFVSGKIIDGPQFLRGLEYLNI